MSTTFPTPQACRAAAQLGRIVGSALEDSGLTPAAYQLLGDLVPGDGGVEGSSAPLPFDPAPVAEATQWLVQRDLVTLDPAADGRHPIGIAVTRAGHDVLAEADRRIAAQLAEVLAPLDENGASAILGALARLLDAMNTHRVEQHDRSRRRAARARRQERSVSLGGAERIVERWERSLDALLFTTLAAARPRTGKAPTAATGRPALDVSTALTPRHLA